MAILHSAPLGEANLAELAGALTQAALPADDIAETGRIFLRYRDADGRTVGFGGMEIHGRSALFRSIVVTPEERGRGWGRAIVDQLNGQARDAGATHAYLLTTTAGSFFETQGFSLVARDKVPPEILATRQAAGLCPATAMVLMKALAP